MPNFSTWLSSQVAPIAARTIAGVFAPLAIFAPAFAQTTAPKTSQNMTQPAFSDVGVNYWASPFIQALATKNIIAGYPDGTFRPARLVNRADFAAMLQKAFPQQSSVRQLSEVSFVDVPVTYWAVPAIENAYQTGFMAGYPGHLFRPKQFISKVQAIVAIAKGLNLPFTDSPTAVLYSYYKDAKTIPKYAINRVASATQARVVVNYPNVKMLAPNQVISRGAAAALIHQALVTQGILPPLDRSLTQASYIVGRNVNRQSNAIQVTIASRLSPKIATGLNAAIDQNSGLLLHW